MEDNTNKEHTELTSVESEGLSNRIKPPKDIELYKGEPLFPKARVLIPTLIVLQVFAILFSSFMGDSLTNLTSEELAAIDWLIRDLTQTFLFFGLVIVFSSVSLRCFFRARVTDTNYLEIINWTFFLAVISVMTALLLFIPLSYITPEFVEAYFLNTFVIFPVGANGEITIWASIIMFFALVIFAPIAEELFFRGFLLGRWKQKWNTRTAIIISSLLFGLAHSDPIGATAFGVVMCLLYLKTKTLYVPMIAHSLNNFAAWLMIGREKYYSPEAVYGLTELQSDWKLLIGLIVLTVIWLSLIMRSKHNPYKWSLSNK